MNFIFAKIFQEFKNQGQGTELARITAYITICYALIGIDIFLMIANRLNNLQNLLVIIGIFLLSFFVTREYYIKKLHINRLEEKYKAVQINKVLLYGIIILFPILILIAGGVLKSQFK